MTTNRSFKLLFVVTLMVVLALVVRETVARASNPQPVDNAFRTPPMSDYKPVEDNAFRTPPMSDYKP
jgi:hypothetical protein